MNQCLQEFYDFFKPLKETVTWSNGKDKVGVGWQTDMGINSCSSGWMEWYEKNGKVFMGWVSTEEEAR